MPIRILLVFVLGGVILGSSQVGVGRAGEPAPPASAEKPAAKPAESPVDAKSARGAIERALPLLKQAARNYPTHRKCFACHHQTFPLLALRESAKRGLERDETVERLVVDFTRASFERQKAKLLEGGRVGGAGLTVSYGLWTLAIADQKTDELSSAMTLNLLKLQNEQGYWNLQAIRPPMEESTVFCAALAIYGLKRFAPPEQQDQSRASIERAMKWQEQAPIESHEDAVGRLLARVWSGAEAARVNEARDTVKQAQRDDGGWAQTKDMQSDAYATGQTLWALREAGCSPQEAAWQRGAAWLIRAQEPDGSWHVVTRAKPVQQYFDNGDPHGKDQFISTTATSWAVAALSFVASESQETPAATADDLEVELSQNTEALHRIFKLNDPAQEAVLYERRERLLLQIRDLKPKSDQPPRVYKGTIAQIAPYKTSGDIQIRPSPSSGVSIEIGRILIPEVVVKYNTLKVGDQVTLTWSHVPSPYNTDIYRYELTGIEVAASGK